MACPRCVSLEGHRQARLTAGGSSNAGGPPSDPGAAQRIQALQYTAGRIAHDLNNYLTAILGYSELLEGHLGSLPKAHTFLSEIVRAAGRAAAYTRELQTFAGRQVLDPDRVDLGAQLQALTPRLEQVLGEGIELTLVLEPGLPRLDLDTDQFEKAILVMAADAAERMAGTGRYRLEVHPAASAIASSPGVLLHAIDSSSAAPDDAYPQALEPFRSGRRGELGLAVAYGIVAQHGGTMGMGALPTGDRCITIALAAPAP